MNPNSETIDRHTNEEPTDQQALLDAVLHGSDQLLAESLRSEERRRRRRRRTTLGFLIGGVVMSVLAIAVAASWLLALDSSGESVGEKKASAAVQAAVVDRQAAVEQAEALEKEGWALWQQQKFDEAIGKFEKAVELDPDAANAWNGLGWAQLNSGQTKAAVKSFTKCVAAEPKHPAGLNGMGQSLLALRDYERAEKYLLKAAPQAPAAWYGLGRLYLLTGKYAAAQKWLRKAAGDAPQDATLQAMIAAAAAKELSDDLRRQIEPVEPPKGVDLARAWQLFFQGQPRSAERLFREALASEPDNVNAMNGLAFCLLNSGKAAEAKPYFEKCLAENPKAGGPMNGLARCLEAEGKIDEAVALWEKLQKLNPEANAATGALARVYTDRGEHAKAVKMYQLLAKAEPENAELKAKLAAAQKASKEGADKQK